MRQTDKSNAYFPFPTLGGVFSNESEDRHILEKIYQKSYKIVYSGNSNLAKLKMQKKELNIKWWLRKVLQL